VFSAETLGRLRRGDQQNSEIVRCFAAVIRCFGAKARIARGAAVVASGPDEQ
jgi:hypothetical protein